MQYDQFVGRIQRRLGLTDTAEAIAAMRATLETLGERLSPTERQHLAAQLPEEAAIYLGDADGSEPFGIGDFFERVGRRAGVAPSDAAIHSRAVMEVVAAAVSEGELEDLRAELPEEYERLFEASSPGVQ